MFDRLFTRPTARARHSAGPLVEDRLAYLEHLANQGMSLKTLRAVAAGLLVICDRLRLVDRHGEMIPVDELQRKANRLVGSRSDNPNWKDGTTARTFFLSQATAWLQFIGRLEPSSSSSDPHASLIDPFAYYMRSDRGLSASTVRRRCCLLRTFFDRLNITRASLRALTVSQIDEFFTEMLRHNGYARTTIQLWAGDLRSFFRYAETRRWCRPGLAAGIESPRVFGMTSIPTGPSWDGVRELLTTTEGDRPADIRDRAILMLLAIYGLRSAEVRRLRLEQLDWERELLVVVCAKTNRTRTYPLCRSVGDAILRYLTEVRPRCAHREVFLSLQAPIQPLTYLYSVVSKRLRRLGFAIPHFGPHALRHACATHLLAQGMSLKEIGDHLGHQDPDTTRIYAKVDLVGLRQVANFDLGGLL